jgi:hypothetical protein
VPQYLEILFVSLKHSVKPRQELLGAVIRVQDNRHTVVLSHQPKKTVSIIS